MSTPNVFANLGAVMNNARVLVNDTYNKGAGELMTNVADFTVPAINSALNELQDRLENNAVVSVTVDNFILEGLEALSQTDPAVQTFLGFAGYGGYTNTFEITNTVVATNVVTISVTSTNNLLKNTMPVSFEGLTVATFLNGLTLPIINVQPTSFDVIFVTADQGSTADTGTAVNQLDPTLALPQDMSSPQFLWERATGSNFQFHEMRQPQEGLPSGMQGVAFQEWEWRGGDPVTGGFALWFRGATVPRDIRIRYRKLEATIAPGTDLTTINIDLPGSFNALSYMIAYRWTAARAGSPENQQNAAFLDAKAEKYIREIIKRTVRQKQGIRYGRKPYGSGGRGNNSGRIF